MWSKGGVEFLRPRVGDRFLNNKSDPSVTGFSEIKRCQNPQFTQIVQKAKNRSDGARLKNAEAHFCFRGSLARLLALAEDAERGSERARPK